MVFYNQLASPEGAVKLELGAKPRFAVNLDALPFIPQVSSPAPAAARPGTRVTVERGGKPPHL